MLNRYSQMYRLKYFVKIVRAGSLLALLLYAAAYSPVTVADIHLNFGVYTAEKPTAMVKIYRPILSELEAAMVESTGEPTTISLQVVSSYEAGVSALVEGDVDFSLLGPASYVMAKARNQGIRILALDSKNHSKTFNGVICVAEDSSIAEIADLRGKSFAFGNEKSTIGRYLSQQHLAEHGVFAGDLAEFEYLGRHDRVGHAVSQGSYDAGALREGTYNKLKKSGASLRALAIFPNVNRPWVAREGLDERLFSALRRSMLNLSAPEAFKKLRRERFVAGADEDFARIRKAIQRNDAFFESAAGNDAVTDTEQ